MKIKEIKEKYKSFNPSIYNEKIEELGNQSLNFLNEKGNEDKKCQKFYYYFDTMKYIINNFTEGEIDLDSEKSKIIEYFLNHFIPTANEHRCILFVNESLDINIYKDINLLEKEKIEERYVDISNLRGVELDYSNNQYIAYFITIKNSNSKDFKRPYDKLSIEEEIKKINKDQNYFNDNIYEIQEKIFLKIYNK